MNLLVIEDEVDLAEGLRLGLQAEGYHVDLAHDGEFGFQLARTGAYALVVCDLMLPGRRGDAICRGLRAEGVTTPVLVLTARDGVADHAGALDGGADDYLVKPFSFPVLLAHLRALERRSPSLTEPEPAVGDLSIDTRRRRCIRAGHTITLTEREFALLDALIRRPGVVITKDDLLWEVWPGEPDDPNLVEARVSALRRKIDTPFGRSSLRTVRGHGYRLIDDRSET